LKCRHINEYFSNLSVNLPVLKGFININIILKVENKGKNERQFKKVQRIIEFQWIIELQRIT